MRFWGMFLSLLAIMVLACVVGGASLWWWLETSAGDWDFRLAEMIMVLLWGMAPLGLWVATTHCGLERLTGGEHDGRIE